MTFKEASARKRVLSASASRPEKLRRTLVIQTLKELHTKCDSQFMELQEAQSNFRVRNVTSGLTATHSNYVLPSYTFAPEICKGQTLADTKRLFKSFRVQSAKRLSNNKTVQFTSLRSPSVTEILSINLQNMEQRDCNKKDCKSKTVKHQENVKKNSVENNFWKNPLKHPLSTSSKGFVPEIPFKKEAAVTAAKGKTML